MDPASTSIQEKNFATIAFLVELQKKSSALSQTIHPVPQPQPQPQHSSLVSLSPLPLYFSGRNVEMKGFLHFLTIVLRSFFLFCCCCCFSIGEPECHRPDSCITARKQPAKATIRGAFWYVSSFLRKVLT